MKYMYTHTVHIDSTAQIKSVVKVTSLADRTRIWTYTRAFDKEPNSRDCYQANLTVNCPVGKWLTCNSILIHIRNLGTVGFLKDIRTFKYDTTPTQVSNSEIRNKP